MKTLILLLLTISLSANADSIDVNLTSLHSGGEYTFNTENFGLGYTFDINNDFSVKAGFYKNSYYKTSKYVSLSYNKMFKSWSFGFDVGIVTGYDDINAIAVDKYCMNGVCQNVEYNNELRNMNKYQLIAYPTMTYYFDKNHAITSGLLPGLNRDSVYIIGLQYRYIFNR